MSVLRTVAMLCLVGTLAACEDSEERAERHFQSGMTLLEQGEVEKALVEFRNVFKLNGSHREARLTYARTVREQGKSRDAYGQYLRLVEQYPDDLEGRVALGEMAFATQNWDEFDRHTEAAIELAPEDPAVRILAVARDYRTSVLDDDVPARKAATDTAITLIKDRPDSPILQQIEIDGYIRDEKYSSALEAIDRALALDPESRQLSTIRLSILSQLQDGPEIEKQLREMVEGFPDDDAFKQALLRYYLAEDQPDKAEDFLREIADPEAEQPTLYVALLEFINQRRGSEAVMAELDAIIPKVSNPLIYQSMRAQLKFEAGDRDIGIAETEALIDGAESTDQIRRIKVNLARMLLQTGNDVGARRLVEEVLAEDATQVDALRMHASWQIEADDTDEAIATLRTALDQAPQDVPSMILMSQAYLRAGNRDLARDFLSLAVDSSAGAPAEALRYARFLAEEGRLIPAEQTLVASLRQNRDNPELLGELGRLYLQMDDQPRLQQVIDSLKGLDTDATRKIAAGLEAALIERQKGADAAISFLEEISEEWDENLGVQIALIRAHLANGEQETALTSARKLLEGAPDDLGRRFVMAATQAATGDLESAETAYRALLEGDGRNNPRVWMELIRVTGARHGRDKMPELLDEALAANPESAELLWAKAGFLEQQGDIDGAIGIYEDLYAQNSNSVVLANNLASLLATHRDDPESIERAARIAARLRDFEQPALRDTWGWITFLQGRTEEALPALEAAAEGLPGDPFVQYHLGRAYEAQNRVQDAIAQYEKTLTLADRMATSQPLVDAGDRLAALRKAQAEDASGD